MTPTAFQQHKEFKKSHEENKRKGIPSRKPTKNLFKAQILFIIDCS